MASKRRRSRHCEFTGCHVNSAVWLSYRRFTIAVIVSGSAVTAVQETSIIVSDTMALIVEGRLPFSRVFPTASDLEARRRRFHNSGAWTRTTTSQGRSQQSAIGCIYAHKVG